MLRALDIRDMLLIDQLSLEFQAGLNVLTGETGAGKSILLDSLGFVLGWRGRADLVRQGAETGEVVAVFDLVPDHPALTVLSDAGILVEGEVILRRQNARDGRKTAWINDRRVSGEVLRRLSECLVELHGQHDDRGLLNPRGHRSLLDSFADLADLRGAVRQGWAARSQAARTLAEAQATFEAAQAEEEFLRHAVKELDDLDPQPGEDATLDADRRHMQAALRVREDVQQAADALGREGAEGRVADAARWLDGAATALEGRLDSALETLSRAQVELAEAQAAVDGALSDLNVDPYTLEQVEERLFALRALARKHGIQPDDLAGLADDLRGRLALVDGGAQAVQQAKLALDEAEQAYTALAAKLTVARQDAATRLDQAMSVELAPLKLDRAQFSTVLRPADPGPDGVDEVEFTVATNPGAPAGPLGKIASGGELSRFLLALKVCLTRNSDGLTLIFDEIDRGVGGATADAVGRRLSALAAAGQVLVVTHSPQVAALGGHHWRVEKRVEGALTTSTVVPLTGSDRVDEIARMLSGDTITDAARAAAQALLP